MCSYVTCINKMVLHKCELFVSFVHNQFDRLKHLPPVFSANDKQPTTHVRCVQHDWKKRNTGAQFKMAFARVWIVWLALVVVQLCLAGYGVVVTKFAQKKKKQIL